MSNERRIKRRRGPVGIIVDSLQIIADALRRDPIGASCFLLMLLVFAAMGLLVFVAYLEPWY